MIAFCAIGQNAMFFSSNVSSAAFPPITLGVHAAHDNGASTATTVVVGPMTPTAGSTIVCDVKYTTSANLTSVADNVNSGVYQIAASMLRDPNHSFVLGTFYKENVAASATTITLTYTATGTNGQMACREWKGRERLRLLKRWRVHRRQIGAVQWS